MNDEPATARRDRRSLAWPAACAAFGVTAVAAVASRPTAAAAPVPVLGGRYQVVALPRESNPLAILVDTETGHTWFSAAGGRWEDRGTAPAEAVK